MLEKFLKKSGWTDIVVSLIFILFGAMLIANPNEVLSAISIILGIICIIIGVLKFIDYVSATNKDNYLIAVSIVTIVIGIIIMFCSDIILSVFRIIIALWIIYSGLVNMQTTIIWKDYKSKLWLVSMILSLIIIIGGIYILVNSGAVLQIVGGIIVAYGIMDIIESVIFIKNIDKYLD